MNLCYVRLPFLYSDIIYYLNCCNTVMPLKCDPAWKIVDDSGFPMTPDRLLNFYGTHVWWLEVFKTITSTCGPYHLGGSATLSQHLRAWPWANSNTITLHTSIPLETFFASPASINSVAPEKSPQSTTKSSIVCFMESHQSPIGGGNHRE
jgi:hypothetical protein